MAPDATGRRADLEDCADPQARAGTAVVRVEAVPLLSYLKDYAAGRLPYWYPEAPFTPGTNGVGTIEAVGSDVHHLRGGQRVALSPLIVANEAVAEPARVLAGLTGISADSGPMLAAWRHGTLAERVLLPAASLFPLDGLDFHPVERLATLGKFIVPMGGLRRGRLAAGETLMVNGATGYFGSAAVLLGLALGAGRVVAAGRDRHALEDVARTAGERVTPVPLTGRIDTDVAALRSASGGGVDLAFDIVGRATDANATLASLGSLRRGGRLVLMGSMTVPLPLDYRQMLANDWEVIGQFMYRSDDYRTLVAMVRGSLVDLGAVRLKTFVFEDVLQAMEAAAAMRGLDCTVVRLPAPS